MATKAPFTFEQRVGQLFTIQSGALSLMAVTFVLSFALLRWLRRFGPVAGTRFEATDSSLFLNLMLWDFIHSLGGLPNIKWMIDAKVTDGGLCIAQGALKHVGIVGVAMSNLTIAIYTFSVLVLRWRPAKNSSKYAVIGVWGITTIIIGIPQIVHAARHEQIFGISGFWCWVQYDFKADQLYGMYMWCWITALSMLILYTITFLFMRGWIDFDRPIVLFGRIIEPGALKNDAHDDAQAQEFARIKAVARLMLYFPATYIITILPSSIARWREFSGHKPPYYITLLVNTIFTLSGFLNFTLFFFTRPRMVIGEKVTVVVRDPDNRRSYSRPNSHSRPFSPTTDVPLHFLTSESDSMGNYTIGSSSRGDVEPHPKND